MPARPLGRDRAAAAPRGSPPPDTRLYVVGDLHGCVDLLVELHQQIHEDAYRVQAPRNVVVYLGDFVDRGPDSRGVVEHLLSEPLPGFERVHLKGNHEAVLLGFLQDPAVGFDWLAFGGDATLESYGVRRPSWPLRIAALEQARDELSARLPAEHRAFFEGLGLSHREGDFLMVHAGLRPGVPVEAQVEQDLLWIRDPFLRSAESFGPIVVHGHTICDQPEIRPNRIGIDTGAFHSGVLTCLVLQGREHGFLQT